MNLKFGGSSEFSTKTLNYRKRYYTETWSIVPSPSFITYNFVPLKRNLVCTPRNSQTLTYSPFSTSASSCSLDTFGPVMYTVGEWAQGRGFGRTRRELREAGKGFLGSKITKCHLKDAAGTWWELPLGHICSLLCGSARTGGVLD